MNYTNHFNTLETPQTQAIPGREAEMKPNNAGGVTFSLDRWKYFERFLVLGSEGGSYYVNENKLTVDNAKNVIDCIQEKGVRAVQTLVEISTTGRAHKNDPAIFALALASTFGDEETKKAAYISIQKV